MADNVSITAGSGTVIATDDISGVHYQRIKLYDATNDSTNGLVVNSSGQLTTILAAGSATIGALTANQSVNLNQLAGTTTAVNNGTVSAGVLRVTVASDSTGQIAAVGKASAGSTISGAPVLLGGAARTSNPTAVTDGQAANVMTDKMGRLVVVQGHARDLVGRQATTITASTSATTIVTAPGASVFADITSLTVTNGSGTATAITLSDGTVSFIYNVPAGLGFSTAFNPPLPATTANTAWTLTCGTSVTSIYCNVVYVKNL